MKTRPDLNILAKEVFEQNKAKGFHEVEQSNETLLMLVITELSEAVEANRGTNRNKRANLESFNRKIETGRSYKGLIPDISKERAYEVIYNETIKGTIEDNLASAVIRLLDLAGLRGIMLNELDLRSPDEMKANLKEAKIESQEVIYATIGLLFEPRYPLSEFDLIEIIDNVLTVICGYCIVSDIDLWQHVELRMKYNKVIECNHGERY